MLKEFRKFITTGNVIEFAVAVIMAGATSQVVKGFVDFIVMPFVGYFTGGINFTENKVVLKKAVIDVTGKVIIPENAIMWGSWVNTIVNLLIVGLVMFIIVKVYNKTKKPVEPVIEKTKGPTQEELLSEIRDLLKK